MSQRIEEFEIYVRAVSIRGGRPFTKFHGVVGYEAGVGAGRT